MPGEGTVTIGERQWAVSLATTPSEWVQGLGGLPSLPPGTGMLFDLGQEQAIRVTTEPMLFDIDIVFIGANLVVTEAVGHVPPGNLVTSRLPSRFFLEVNAGEAGAVQPGDQVTVQVRSMETPGQDALSQLTGLMMAVAVYGMVFSLVSGVGRAMLPRPRREGPGLYEPRGKR